MIKKLNYLSLNICAFKLKRVLTIFLLLILVPIFFYLIDFKYSTNINDYFDFYFFLLITGIASVPFTILTSIFFTAILLFVYKSDVKNMIILAIFVNLIVLSSQAFVFFTKLIIKEPRPYIEVLVEKNYIKSSKDFYSLNKRNRVELINNMDLESINIPFWQKEHLKHEVGYSFPSGHTVFIATWTILLFCFLLEKRRYFLASLFYILAFSIELSRLLLGMHFWQDLFASVCISFFTVVFYIFIIRFKLLKSF
ncbi:phosphatase PAP2 family protein [Arcobacter porcinus]|uniref:phosphatase PAP2 family protein n=1 Tax=Arcobacter porcinus TaxID=1935204 RepID=UPI00081DA7F4|nr:phosphatase PAP2 family protein [Arcobacter porcinus]OCL84531.1 Phosphatidylglycerophosphatase B [Arcobacter porcinus]OCL89073.1 Phosphatidylglycerophosphatase B [Arcobacter porcinus]